MQQSRVEEQFDLCDSNAFKRAVISENIKLPLKSKTRRQYSEFGFQISSGLNSNIISGSALLPKSQIILPPTLALCHFGRCWIIVTLSLFIASSSEIRNGEPPWRIVLYYVLVLRQREIYNCWNEALTGRKRQSKLLLGKQ